LIEIERYLQHAWFHSLQGRGRAPGSHPPGVRWLPNLPYADSQRFASAAATFSATRATGSEPTIPVAFDVSQRSLTHAGVGTR
jgi:hypothetical protein